MALATMIARTTDGLILVETQDGLGKLSGPPLRQTRRVLAELRAMPSRCSLKGVGGAFTIHLNVVDGVSYLAVFDSSYPRNFAFAFLADIQELFQAEMSRQFGTGSVDYRSQIETIERPHYFVKLDRTIAKKEAEYRDTSSGKALARLHTTVQQVSSIMSKSIDELLPRGDNLEETRRKSTALKSASGQFAAVVQRIALYKVWDKYCVPALLCLLSASIVWVTLTRRGEATYVVVIILVLLGLFAKRSQTKPLMQSASVPSGVTFASDDFEAGCIL